MPLIVLDGVVDDARKAVVRDLQTSNRGVLDGVGIDEPLLLLY